MAVSLDNPVVRSYILYSAILALKLLAMSGLTAFVRIVKKSSGKLKPNSIDPDVERTRRANLNDLENIPAFWILGGLYVTTAPAVSWAILLFRVYTLGRIIHSIVYAVLPLPQPTRAIAYGVPYLITWYMGIQVVLYYVAGI